MSGAAPILVRSFRVGRYEFTMTFRTPKRGEVHWFTAEMVALRAAQALASAPAAISARDRAIRELAAEIGGKACS